MKGFWCLSMSIEKVENEQADYSVISTSVSVVIDAGILCVEKRYLTHVDLSISIEELKALVDEYILDCLNAKINMPKIMDSYIKSGQIYYRSVYAGENLVSKGFSSSTFANYDVQVEQMLRELRKAQIAGIMIDPHTKNFVFDGDNVYFVDVFPPYSMRFNELRNAVSTPDEKSIVDLNLVYFHPENIGPHFCGDLLNIDPAFGIHFEDIYTRLVRHEIFAGNFQEFKKKAYLIRKTEDERLSRKIFLV